MTAFASHVDENQQFTITGVIGTLGTADEAGTAKALPIGVNPSTGAVYVEDLSTSNGTNVNIVTGTINSLPQVSIGTIPQVSVGTLPTVTLADYGTNVNVITGTINSLPQISIGTLPTVTLDNYGSNVNIVTGTVGSITNIGVIHNAGTIVALPQVSVGTVPQVSVGTMPQVSIGTIPTVNLSDYGTNIEVVNGTVTLVSTLTTVSNLTNGSVNILTGTVTRLSNIGTLESGTLQINKIPVQVGTPIHVRGTTGAAVWGTIVVASGAGTKQYISRISIVVVSGTVDVALTNIGVGGSTGAGVLERGQFVPSAGITNNYDPVIPSGTNGTISYWLGGAGTVDMTINYWQGV